MLPALFTSPAAAEATSPSAWLRAMVEVEVALAIASAQVGLVPHEAADALRRALDGDQFDLDADRVAREAVATGTPVVPLLRQLREQLPDPAGAYLHTGATSQDIVDTATMLVVGRAADALLADLAAVAGECARLAAEHRSTVMAGRTLGQQALPTTFGRTVAGWLVGVTDAAAALDRLRHERLAVQLGGAVGTNAALDGHGTEIADRMAARLALARPVLPWHTERTRVAEVACAYGVLSGVLGKIALDLRLLAQTEVGEVAERDEPGHGASSTMPHKRNPVRAVLASAAVEGVAGYVSTMLSTMRQEYERAGGAWQAEWEALAGLLRHVAAAAWHVREALGGLRVDAQRMLANVQATGGLLMAERVSIALARRAGRTVAGTVIEQACRDAVAERRPLLDVLLGNASVTEHFEREELRTLLDPAAYLGASHEQIDAALAHHAGRDWWKRPTG